MRILVSGMMARVPHQGGATWAVLQYILGLRRLGHDVTFVETLPSESLVPEGTSPDRSANASYFRSVTRRYGLDDRASLLVAGTKDSVGITYSQLARIANDADLVLNVSGALRDEALLMSVPRRVYVDLDPTFTQLWHSCEGVDMGLEAHTHFVTVGLALGSPSCPVPTCGRHWMTTLQPVVLEQWPPATLPPSTAFTTVGNWRSYGSIRCREFFYGQRAHSLRRLLTLPALTREHFRLALAIDPGDADDVAALRAHGWHVVDPQTAAATPHEYQGFIRDSKAELGVAKEGYVISRCGWFSDRSACYLASGRPVLAQDTGFGDYLPTGKGLLAFSTVEDAALGVKEINGDHALHAGAARALAEEYFDSDKVLGALLDALGAQ
jgi:hypothetical protein